MEKTREWTGESLHVFMLCSFAVAQPLFAVLSDGPAFFVAHHARPLDVWLLVSGLCLALPALIVTAELLVGRVRPASRRHLHYVIIPVLLTLALLPVAKRLDAMPGWACVLGASFLGLAGAVAYFRLQPVRTFATALSPAIILFPCLFLFHSPVTRIALASKQSVAEVQLADNDRAPVIVVIMDELPTASLMNEQRLIDPAHYPNLAQFSQDATWFRNATTVRSSTTEAIPAILTGRRPADHGKPGPPTIEEYPDNLYTLLSQTHQLYAFTWCTALCPKSLNRVAADFELWRRLRAIASDVWIIYRHIVLPRDLIRDGFPEISGKWANFREDRRAWGDPQDFFREFIDSVKVSAQPRLYVVHSRLPHVPFEFMPSGKRYTEHDHDHYMSLIVKGKPSKWIDDEQLMAREYQRHLLQVGCADTMLGELINHLKEIGMYDDALVVITADHGVSHQPNECRRTPTATNVEDIMPVPLLIKAPGQQAGAISDRNVESIDVLPTVASLLGVEVPWLTDGCNALDSTAAERPRKRINDLVVDASFETKFVALDQKLKLFGRSTDPHGLYRVGPHGELVGQTIDMVTQLGTADIRVQLSDAPAAAFYDPESDFVPALIKGRIETPAKVSNAPVNLAVAINGTIRGVARVSPSSGAAEWTTLVAEDSFRPGQNDVQVFVVTENRRGVVLQRAQDGDGSATQQPVPANATPAAISR